MSELEEFRSQLTDPDADLDEEDARAAARLDAEWAASHAAEIARAHPDLYRHLILALAAQDESWAVIAGIAIVQAKAIPKQELLQFLSWHEGRAWAFVVSQAASE